MNQIAPRRRSLGQLASRLVRLSVPISIGRFGVIAMGVVDTIVVGQLAPHQLAWQALGWTLTGPALLGGIALSNWKSTRSESPVSRLAGISRT